MVAEADETLMEHFFEAGTLTQEELVAGLKGATAAGKLFPVVCASGLQNVGTQPLLDAIAHLPAVAGRAAVPGTGRRRAGRRAHGRREPRPTRRSSGRRWPTSSPAASRCSASIQGMLKSDSTVHNVTREEPGTPRPPLVLQGKTQMPVPEIKAGDLGAVAKLKDTRTNDTIADKAAGITFAPITFPEPVLSYAIEPKSRGDEDKISTVDAPARGRGRHRSATRATRRPTSCCSPARASSTSRSRSRS